MSNIGETVTIVITRDGHVTVQVKGVAGPACMELTKFLEESLGQVTQREYTSEYYQARQLANVARITGRRDA